MRETTKNENKDNTFEGDYVGRDRIDNRVNIIMYQDKESSLLRITPISSLHIILPAEKRNCVICAKG